MPAEDARVARLETDLRELTGAVRELTGTTEQLAKGWGELQDLMKQQVEHGAHLEHYRLELDRAFKQIYGVRSEAQALREAIAQLDTKLQVAAAVDRGSELEAMRVTIAELNTKVQVAAAVDRERVGFFKGLLENWQTIVVIAAAAAAAGYKLG